ncbi:MAG: transcription termination factor Rho [Gemmataceae bacterium]|nr:transcription termination factor Rho [Gemmataceae bacterium]
MNELNTTNHRTVKETKTAAKPTRRVRRPRKEEADHVVADRPLVVEPAPRPADSTHLRDFQATSAPELLQIAHDEGVESAASLARQDLIAAIFRARGRKGQTLRADGTLEVLPEGYGFLRHAQWNYLTSPEDVYVSPAQVRRLGLQTGMTVEGTVRAPFEGQQYLALLQVEAINGQDPEQVGRRVVFEDLTPLHPSKRLLLETDPGDLNTRVIDLVTPIGKGQRGLIVAPPRTGKTVLLQKIARSIQRNHPECHLIVLLIDERPEEVTEMQRAVTGLRAEVIASTFDEPAKQHIRVAEIVLERTRRLVEFGQDVVILLDSITRLARAYNSEAPANSKTLTGGLTAGVLEKPKRFFGSARAIEGGGSLTILATALVDTGSKMDEVIFEEFKGTGNMELHLDRRLVDKRVWPAIDVNASGTRREELLLDAEELRRVWLLRKVLSDMNPVEAMELLTGRLRKTRSNAEFLLGMHL